jgi:hypothetical protein
MIDLAVFLLIAVDLVAFLGRRRLSRLGRGFGCGVPEFRRARAGLRPTRDSKKTIIPVHPDRHAVCAGARPGRPRLARHAPTQSTRRSSKTRGGDAWPPSRLSFSRGSVGDISRLPLYPLRGFRPRRCLPLWVNDAAGSVGTAFAQASEPTMQTRRLRELLRLPRDRAARPAHLQDPRSSPARPLPMDRQLLERSPPTLHPRLPQPREVRTDK